MRLIEDFDKKNYDDCIKLFHRKAVRAIIIKEGKLALIKSEKFGEYKFPGGGKEDHESDIDTLIRETREESGLNIITDSIKPYGMMMEKRKSTFDPTNIFQMESYYYLCEVSDGISETNLDFYELEYGYKLHFVSIEEAITNNEKALIHQEQVTWIERELCVLKDIKKNLF
ncbi:MAG: NUDIX domain-containing protein [Acholeplasmataceae bacterium]|nr:NUDIX domain-containing protein [Acholeplasmataceae bacterium]